MKRSLMSVLGNLFGTNTKEASMTTSDTSPGGHHPVHTGIQNHSMGDCYPFAVVGYGDNPTLYVVENLAEGTVLCRASFMEPHFAVVYQSYDCATIRALLIEVLRHQLPTDCWVKGRPTRTEYGTLRL